MYVRNASYVLCNGTYKTMIAVVRSISMCLYMQVKAHGTQLLIFLSHVLCTLSAVCDGDRLINSTSGTCAVPSIVDR